MSINLQTVTAASIREGDAFLMDERMVWHAVSDARLGYDHHGAPVVLIDVQHHPDGGLETRCYVREMEWGASSIRRAPAPQDAA